MNLFEKIGNAVGSETGQLAIAGALGGVVRWVTLKENKRDGLASLIVGAISAVYLGPLIAPMIEPTIGKIAPNQGAEALSAFLTGIGGISISAFLIELFRKQKGSNKKDDEGSDE